MSVVPTPIDVLSVAPLSATGSVLPSPTIISLSASASITVIAPVPLPSRTPPSVRVETPVPPSATAKSVIPLIVPPLISTVVIEPKSATVFPALVQFPFMEDKSISVADTLPNEPVDVNELLTLPRTSKLLLAVTLPAIVCGPPLAEIEPLKYNVSHL